MTKKTISDVLEYLYRNKKRELAQAVIEELRRPPAPALPELQPARPFSPLTPIFTTPTPPNSFPIEKPTSWMGTTATVDKPEEKEYPTITK